MGVLCFIQKKRVDVKNSIKTLAKIVGIMRLKGKKNRKSFLNGRLLTREAHTSSVCEEREEKLVFVSHTSP